MRAPAEVVPPPEPVTAVAEYSPTAAALAGLRQKYGSAVFDVRTTAGMDEARKARAELRTYRVDLEKLRKQIKAPALERCRLIDSEASRITTELEALEAPIHDQIAAEEARKEVEREAKRQAEVQRVRDIHARIDGIRRAPLLMTGASTARIAEKVAELQGLTIAASDYAEFTTDAEAARSEALAALGATYDAARAAELEAARLVEERAALERQRQEQARIEAEAAAERKRQDDAARAERDKADREAREAREREEAAAKTRREEEERIAREQRQREEAEAKAKRDAEEESARVRHEQEERRARQEREAEEAKLAEQRAEIAKQQAALEERQRQESEAETERQREIEAEQRKQEEDAEVERLQTQSASPVTALTAIAGIALDPDVIDAVARLRIAKLAAMTLVILRHATDDGK